SALAGLAVPARVSAGRAGFEDGLLFTHRGLSGPSILQVSSHWAPGAAIRVDFLPGRDASAVLADLRRQAGGKAAGKALAALAPERLARALADWAGAPGRLADLDAAALARLAGVLGHWTLRPTGSEGYRTAEVTCGGVDTRDLDARTLAARAVPGLHFVGEGVVVTGGVGGYNSLWAGAWGWAGGLVA
ncbi:MAG: aminoacetone oxidase family FAD-binding enzyme, partial [Gemmobacter sp.]